MESAKQVEVVLGQQWLFSQFKWKSSDWVPLMGSESDISSGVPASTNSMVATVGTLDMEVSWFLDLEDILFVIVYVILILANMYIKQKLDQIWNKKIWFLHHPLTRVIGALIF